MHALPPCPGSGPDDGPGLAREVLLDLRAAARLIQTWPAAGNPAGIAAVAVRVTEAAEAVESLCERLDEQETAMSAVYKAGWDACEAQHARPRLRTA